MAPALSELPPQWPDGAAGWQPLQDQFSYFDESAVNLTDFLHQPATEQGKDDPVSQ